VHTGAESRERTEGFASSPWRCSHPRHSHGALRGVGDHLVRAQGAVVRDEWRRRSPCTAVAGRRQMIFLERNPDAA
jgi:hypothetical protein